MAWSRRWWDGAYWGFFLGFTLCIGIIKILSGVIR